MKNELENFYLVIKSYINLNPSGIIINLNEIRLDGLINMIYWKRKHLNINHNYINPKAFLQFNIFVITNIINRRFIINKKINKLNTFFTVKNLFIKTNIRQNK